MKILIQGFLKEELQRGGSSSHSHSHHLLPQDRGRACPCWTIEHGNGQEAAQTMNFPELCP